MERSESRPDRTRSVLFLAIAVLLVAGCKQLRGKDPAGAKGNAFQGCDVFARSASSKEIKCPDLSLSWEADDSGAGGESYLEGAVGRLGGSFDEHAEKEKLEYELDGRKHKAIRVNAEGKAGAEQPPPRALLVLVPTEKRNELFACMSQAPQASYEERCRGAISAFLRSAPEPNIQMPDPASFANCQVVAPRPEERQVRCLNLVAFIKEAPRNGVEDERILELWQRYFEQVNRQPLQITEKKISASFGGRDWTGMRFTGTFQQTGDPFQGTAFVRSAGENARVVTCMATEAAVERCKVILEAVAHVMPRPGSH